MSYRPLSAAAMLVIAAGSAAPALAQSDPALFDFVYNIGTVPPGSMFDITDADIPGVLTLATEVGDGNGTPEEAFLSPILLDGDTLGSGSQLNLFDGGDINRAFSAGSIDGLSSNVEINIFGGSVERNFNANPNGTVNLFGGSIDFGLKVIGGTVNIFGGNINSGGPASGRFEARSGSTINVSGGSIGSRFEVHNSTVNISGGTVGRDFRVFSGGIVNVSGGAVDFDF
jgi:hypothetical protein